MKKFDLYGLLKRVEGDIVPIGDTNYDEKCGNALRSWEYLHFLMTNKLIKCAKGEPGRHLASVKEVSDEVRDYLKEMYETLGTYIEQWDGEDK